MALIFAKIALERIKPVKEAPSTHDLYKSKHFSWNNRLIMIPMMCES